MIIPPPPLRRPLPTMPPRRLLRARDRLPRLELITQPPPPVDTEWSSFVWMFVIGASIAMLFVAMALGGGP